MLYRNVSLYALIALAVATTSKRDEIVQRAFTVFYQNGFHASGVNSFLEGAGISKRTLYKYFTSKEALIAATITYYSRRNGEAVSAFLTAHPHVRGDARVLLLFDWLESLAESGHLWGCYAINAKLEYATRDADIEACCAKHFSTVKDWVTQLCRASDRPGAMSLVEPILTLFHGAIVRSQGEAAIPPIRSAKLAAKLLLESKPPAPSGRGST